ncbi:MAG TPA: hypothetical protein VI461_14645 [Chitinophagaceae bacterium]|nr:hypothetical protein [Chitinophagaceae bacterium]
MLWLIILVVIAAFVCWLLFSPLILEIDTRIPRAGLRWINIGNAWIWYENEWWLSFRILFFRKTIRFAEIKSKPKKIAGVKKKRKRKRKMQPMSLLKKIIRVLKTFRVTKWQLAVDTGDYVRNAQLYPLNYTKYTFNHLYINFTGENYLTLGIRNRPWKIIYALLK